MVTTKLGAKRIIIPAVAAAALGGLGATVWIASADTDVQGRERDRAASAAVRAAGGGTAVEVETSDEVGESYEVKVRKDDGTEHDVTLDQDLKVIRQEADDDASHDEADDHASHDEADGDASHDEADGDDRALTAAERTSAARAALDAVGGGRVEEVEASDDRGTSYEVEVKTGDGTEWDVRLDADFQVLSKTADD
jgi:uncharacterized membrane protein YkoI